MAPVRDGLPSKVPAMDRRGKTGFLFGALYCTSCAVSYPFCAVKCTG